MLEGLAYVWGLNRVPQVDEQALHTALTTRAIETVGERIVKSLSKDAAVESRDSLAKNLYARMFDWLVAAVNRKISALGTLPLQ
jgi:myosin V